MFASFFGRKNALWCLFTGLLSVLQPGSHPTHGARALAFQQYGRWEIVQSNDPLVASVPSPRIVHIAPGQFHIGTRIWGTFVLVDTPPTSGVHVAMDLYNLRMFRRTFKVELTDADRMALFGTGKDKGILYRMERLEEQDA